MRKSNTNQRRSRLSRRSKLLSKKNIDIASGKVEAKPCTVKELINADSQTDEMK